MAKQIKQACKMLQFCDIVQAEFCKLPEIHPQRIPTDRGLCGYRVRLSNVMRKRGNTLVPLQYHGEIDGGKNGRKKALDIFGIAGKIAPQTMTIKSPASRHHHGELL